MHLSDLPNRIRKLMSIIDPADEMLLHILKTEAERFEAAIRQGGDIRYACEQETLAEARRVEIESLNAKVAEIERTNLELRARVDDVRSQMERRLAESEKVISDIAEAAECDNFADIIIARVSALAQQANAMTRICEGHIATCRKETAKAADYLAANKTLSERLDALNNQDNRKRVMLHSIADELGAGSRNAIPEPQWFLSEIRKLKGALETYKAFLKHIHEAVGNPDWSDHELVCYLRGLDIAALQAKAADAEKVKAEAERRVRELETALAARQYESKEARWDKFKTEALRQLLTQNGYWPQYDDVTGLKKLTAYVANLKTREASITAELASRDRTIAELQEKVTILENAAQRGCQAENELSLSVGAIKRMYAKLTEYRQITGIWPDDGVFRAKLDDIEWCLNVYVGRYCEALSQRDADTKFIASVRDSLSHEILRRNKQ